MGSLCSVTFIVHSGGVLGALVWMHGDPLTLDQVIQSAASERPNLQITVYTADGVKVETVGRKRY